MDSYRHHGAPRLLTAVVLSVCILSTSIGTGRAIADEPFQYAEKIDELVQALVTPGVIRGVSVGVIDHERTWTKSYGTLSEDGAATADPDTIYEIGSISKVFTGILLASAVGAGEVTLDTPIGSIASPLVRTNHGLANSILLRHLATHSSGLPRMPDNWKPADANQPYADYNDELMMEYLATAKLTSEPGKPSGYSNFAVGLLGELLAMKAEVSYEQLLKQRIIDPLAMSSTSIRVRDENQSRVAPPYQSNGDRGDEWMFDAFAGAGAIHSTTSDMLRFIDAHLHPLQDASLQPLAQAIELAWQQHLPAANGGFAMGLGWHLARDGKTRWHSGQTGGYDSMMLVNRELQCGVIVLSNTASVAVDALGESILQTLAGASVEPVKIPDVTLPAEEIQRLAGDYVLTPEFVLSVTVKKDHLFVQATNQGKLRVYPESLTQWSYHDVDAKLTFGLPEVGNATSLTLHQNGRDMKATRR